jgi:trehalose synthase-fused probable maltokinase
MSARDLLVTYGMSHPETLLAEWLPRQRWYGGQGVPAVAIADSGLLVDDGMTVIFTLLEVGDGAGASRYHVPLGVRPIDQVWELVTPSDRVIAEGVRDGSPIGVYDALADADVALTLWALVDSDREVATAAGTVRGHNYGSDAAGESHDAVRPLAREQSNTSLVLADRELMKCFRRVEEGISPELEMTQALRAAGFANIAAPLGTLEYVGRSGERSLLALIQPFLPNGTEGWALALTSLRDLYSEAELAGPRGEAERRRAVEEQGAAFTPEAARLGEVTAAMHLALCDEAMPPGMRGEPADRRLLAAWADEQTAELDRVLAADNATLEPLRARRAAVAAHFDALRSLQSGGLAIRIHGDYHLGQVMRIDEGWVVLDFEGEPDRPLAERRQRTSALRDVAGMLRSFDYAAAAALAERSKPGGEDWQALLPQGQAWAEANRASFWNAYAARVEGSPLLPPRDATITLLRAFEFQKAVYEVGYELGHRPDWLLIPLQFLLGTAP